MSGIKEIIIEFMDSEEETYCECEDCTKCCKGCDCGGKMNPSMNKKMKEMED